MIRALVVGLLLAGAALLALMRWKSPPWVVVVACAVVGWWFRS